MYTPPGPGQGPTQPFGQGYQPPPPLQQYQQTQPFTAPLRPRRPLSEAFLALPGQSLRVITRPFARTFAREAGEASWEMLWVQLIGYALLVGIFGALSSLISSLMGHGAPSSGATSALMAALGDGSLTLGAALLQIPLVPLFFFIGVSVQYLVARAFHGEGRFMVQGYCSLLYQVPLGGLSAVLGLLVAAFPGSVVLDLLVGVPLFVYAAVLNGCMVAAVHKLSGGRAAGVVLIPYGLLLVLLLCVCSISAALTGFLS